jgi:pimeloyl-ACP methyl ester carboxylesterase
MHDVQAILDAIGCKQAALFGVSEGGPMSLLYAATYPHRTSALVIYGSYAKRSRAPDYPFGWDDQEWQRVLEDRRKFGLSAVAEHWHADGRCWR